MTFACSRRVRAADVNLSFLGRVGRPSIAHPRSCAARQGKRCRRLLIDRLLIRHEPPHLLRRTELRARANRLGTLGGSPARWRSGTSARQPTRNCIFRAPLRQAKWSSVGTSLAASNLEAGAGPRGGRGRRAPPTVSSTVTHGRRSRNTCGVDQFKGPGAAVPREGARRAVPAHGEHSIHHERVLLQPGGVRPAMATSPASGCRTMSTRCRGREQPPSTHLFRRPKGRCSRAAKPRDYQAASSSTSGGRDAEAMPIPDLRARPIFRYCGHEPCVLAAQRGESGAAERFRGAAHGRGRRGVRRHGRITYDQSALYYCLSLAQRKNGPPDDAGCARRKRSSSAARRPPCREPKTVRAGA